MSSMFSRSNFNRDISNWNTSKVTDMKNMFSQNDVFNQDIGNWNTAMVTDMSNMFSYAEAFNQDIGDWDTSKVTNIYGMFYIASSFNQDIGNWDTSKVTIMRNLFNSCYEFNLDLSNWNVTNVSNMDGMFGNAKTFNQDLSNWNVASMNSMFYGVLLSTANYDAMLTSWSALDLQDNVVFNAGETYYCSNTASTARANMIANNSWDITDLGTDCNDSESFVTLWENTGFYETITIPSTDHTQNYTIDWGGYSIDWKRENYHYEPEVRSGFFICINFLTLTPSI